MKNISKLPAGVEVSFIFHNFAELKIIVKI